MSSRVSKNLSVKGFTLIELMVVISIIGILVGMGFTSLVDASRRESVEQSANDIKTVIEQARFNALSKVKPSACVSNPLRFHNVNFSEVSGVGKVTVSAACVNGTGSLESYQVLEYKLPSNIKFVTGGIGCANLKFEVITNAVTCSDDVITDSKSISIKGYDIVRKVNIDKNGNITVSE